jgi:hypothetical protein
MIDYADRSMRFDNYIYNGRKNPKVELKEIFLKVIFMYYYRDPDSVVLIMINLDKKK